MTRQQKKILVTGHPRSGTGYMSVLLQKYGLDVGHEVMGRDGISSWTFANLNATKIPRWTKDDAVPSDYDFIHRIHVLRNPVDCVSSIRYTEDINCKSFLYRMAYVTKAGFDVFKLNRIEHTVASYCVWNNLIRNTKPNLTLVLESAELPLHNYLIKTNLIEQHAPLITFKEKVNARNHPKLSLNDINDALENKRLIKMWKNYLKWYNDI